MYNNAAKHFFSQAASRKPVFILQIWFSSAREISWILYFLSPGLVEEKGQTRGLKTAEDDLKCRVTLAQER